MKTKFGVLATVGLLLAAVAAAQQSEIERAIQMNQQAVTLHNEGKTADAIKLLQQALELQRRALGADHAETAMSLGNLGALQRATGDLAGAKTSFAETVRVLRKSVGSDHVDTAEALFNLGLVLQATTDDQGARDAFAEAYRIRRLRLSVDDPELAQTALHLGFAEFNRGDYAAAAPLYDEALRIRRKLHGGDHPAVAVVLNNQGALRYALGDLAGARTAYDEALAIRRRKLGSEHVETAVTLNNLGALLFADGKFEEANKAYQEALTVRRKVLGENHPVTATTYNNLGALNAAWGQFDVARTQYEAALKIRRGTLGEEHRDTASTLNNFGAACYAQRLFAEARPLFTRAVEVRRKVLGADHPETATSLHNLAALAAAEGKWDEAAGLEDQCRRGVRGHIAKNLPSLREQEQLTFLKHTDRQLLHTALSLSLARPNDAFLVRRTANWLANGKAMTAEALARRVLAAREAAEPPRAGAWVEADQVSNALPPNAAFVDFARFSVFDFTNPADPWRPARYVAWITTRDGVRQIDLGATDAIDKAIRDVKAKLESAARPDGALVKDGEVAASGAMTDELRELAKRTWAPLAPHLANAKEIILSPDGMLWFVPWIALPDEKDTVLLERYAFRFAVSGRDLVSQSEKRADLGPPVIFADPDFDSPNAAKSPPPNTDVAHSFTPAKGKLPKVGSLPGTALEAKVIRTHVEKLAGVEALLHTSSSAAESAAKALRRPKVAVFATHGFFLPSQQTPLSPSAETRGISLDEHGQRFESPLLRCGLLLAGCNQETPAGDDGILTGEEILCVDFRGTALVVLSACQTGIGDLRDGEGVAGLRQAFQLAGARAVVASAWEVPDRDTALIMEDFFRNLAEGKPQSEALRAAQLKRLNARRERSGAAHPFFWAAWTITGRDASP